MGNRMAGNMEAYVIGNNIKGTFRFKEEIKHCEGIIEYKLADGTEHFDGIVKSCIPLENSNGYFVNNRYIITYEILNRIIQERKKNDHIFFDTPVSKPVVCDFLEARELVAKATKCNTRYKLFRVNAGELEEVNPKIDITVDLN